MIQFEDLDLICRVENDFYKLVIDGVWAPLDACSKCAFLDKSLCDDMPCYDKKYNFNFHYEEIPK